MLRRCCFSVAVGASWLFAIGENCAEATGYWNLPSSFWQCAGCGCGGGYHAPLVLGPVSCDGWYSRHHYRLPYSPASSYGGAQCCGGFEQPTVLEPARQPAAAPIAPAAQLRRPLFLR
jgi:hypothetical protein